jgi:thiamine biosynthesis lipoprotein
MGTLIEVTIQGSDNDLAQHAINKAFNEMTRIEKIMSTHLPNSELSKLNTLATRETKIAVSSDLLKVVKRGIHWGKLSSGTMDITIGPAVKL